MQGIGKLPANIAMGDFQPVCINNNRCWHLPDKRGECEDQVNAGDIQGLLAGHQPNLITRKHKGPAMCIYLPVNFCYANSYRRKSFLQIACQHRIQPALAMQPCRHAASHNTGQPNTDNKCQDSKPVYLPDNHLVECLTS